MEKYLIIIGIIAVIFVIAKYVLKLNTRKVIGLLVNCLLGALILWLINWLPIGLNIPLNWITILVTGVFGVVGVLVLVVLALCGII